jgi:hypothetical protein
MFFPMNLYMIDIEMFKISILFQMRVDHNSNYFTVRQGKLAVSGFFRAVLLQNVSRLGFVKFLAEFILRLGGH